MSSDPARESATRVRLLVMAKSPVAGRVKTRLCPPFSLVQAAELAAAAIADTLAAAVAAVPMAARHGFILEPILVLDGRPQGWLPQLLQDTIGRPVRLRVFPQRGDGLDDRLAAAFDDAAGELPAVLIGMDTPQVTAGILVDAITELMRPGCEAVLGHADDGGWWLLGLRRADPALLQGVPMSTSTTGIAQQARLQASGLRVSLLRRLRDVDTVEDAERVAAQAPDSRFACRLEQLRLSVAATL